MKNKSGLVLFIIASLVVSGCGSGEKKASNEEEAVEVAAKVDDWSLSRADLQTVIDGMPESQKSKYDTPGGRAELADLLIAEELYYREGLKMGLDNKENIQKQIERFARGLVVKEYYSNSIEPLAHPSEEEMRDYYEDNREKFSSQPIARAQHIFSTSKEKLVKLKKRIDAGEKFTTLAQKYSEDEHSKADGGDLGFFNPGGYIRGMAYSDEISDVCFSLPVGVVSEPVKWRKGWSLVVVTERRPSTTRPFDDVRDDILGYFVGTRLDRVKKVAFGELQKKYDVDNLMAKELRLTTRTAEELWNLAQNSSDSYQRRRHYEEIVDRFPDSDHAAKAMFMVGFVNAEELKDFPAADRAFTRVLNEYPDSDVVESAKYMLEQMSKPAPNFEDPGLSDETEEHQHDH